MAAIFRGKMVASGDCFEGDGEKLGVVAWKMLIIKARSEKKGGWRDGSEKNSLLAMGFCFSMGPSGKKIPTPGCIVSRHFIDPMALFGWGETTEGKRYAENHGRVVAPQLLRLYRRRVQQSG